MINFNSCPILLINGDIYIYFFHTHIIGSLSLENVA